MDSRRDNGRSMDDAVETAQTDNVQLFDGVCGHCGKQTKTPIRHADSEQVFCFECIMSGQASS